MESDIIISTREQHTESEEIKMTDYLVNCILKGAIGKLFSPKMLILQ